MENWKLLTKPFDEDLRQVIHIQHLAVQFLSLTGRYLIPEIKDQDNITMQFDSDDEMFIGKQHPEGWLVSLTLNNLKLQIRDQGMGVISEIALVGKTFPEVLIEFKKKLHESGADVSLFRTEQPYELNTEWLEKGLFFTMGPGEAVKENIKYRHNANGILKSICRDYKDTSPVFTWPNHFDTGFSFPVEHNKGGGISKTIGMGWAIPDEMVDEPYYYLSLHSEQSLSESGKPDVLPSGEWIMTGWTGAVLKLSEIVAEKKLENQVQLVRSFFETGVKRLVEHFNISQ